MKNIVLLLLMFLSFSNFSQEKDAEYYNDSVSDSLFQNDTRLFLAYMSKAIQLNPDNLNHYRKRSQAYAKSGNRHLALKDLRKVIEVDSTQAEDYYQIANYLAVITFTNNDLSNVLNNLDIAIKLDSTRPEFYNLKSRVYIKFGYFEDAIKTYKKINNLFPDKYLNINDEIIKLNKQINNEIDNSITGTYYPFTRLNKLDSLKYPMKIGVELNIKSIEAHKIDENYFRSNIDAYLYSNYPEKYISNSFDNSLDLNSYIADTILTTDLNKNIFLQTTDGNHKIIYDSFQDDSYDWADNEYLLEVEDQLSKTFKFNHIWDLSDFPFDKQRLNIKFISLLDSSVVHFEKRNSKSIKDLDQIKGLQIGQQVEEINFSLQFEKTAITSYFSPSINRAIVSPVANFEIIISRSGSLLFIKLFLGTFLAFIMSLSAFTISKRNFPSRIDVSVGALFIAVGNKYFVESTTPMVQILTKADIINNISLLLIIMNVVFIISQHRKDINIGKFEDSKYTLKFSAALLAALVFITIIF